MARGVNKHSGSRKCCPNQKPFLLHQRKKEKRKKDRKEGRKEGRKRGRERSGKDRRGKERQGKRREGKEREDEERKKQASKEERKDGRKEVLNAAAAAAMTQVFADANVCAEFNGRTEVQPRDLQLVATIRQDDPFFEGWKPVESGPSVVK